MYTEEAEKLVPSNSKMGNNFGLLLTYRPVIKQDLRHIHAVQDFAHGQGGPSDVGYSGQQVQAAGQLSGAPRPDLPGPVGYGRHPLASLVGRALAALEEAGAASPVPVQDTWPAQGNQRCIEAT